MRSSAWIFPASGLIFLRTRFPDTGQAIREKHDHRDEQTAHREEPELRKGFREETLAGVDQQRSVDRAVERGAPADRRRR